MMTQIAKQVVVDGVDAQTIFAEFNKIERLIADNNAINAAKTDQNKILTREEVAKLFQISLPTLNEWTKKGIFQSYRLGNTVRYKEKEVMLALKPIPKRYN